MQVRHATLDDVPEIVRLKAVLMETGWPFEVDLDDGWRERAEAVARELVVDPHQGWFVVDDPDDPDGGLAGCVSVTIERHLPGPHGSGRSAYLGDMATDPRHQRRGIGAAMLERALVWAAEQGAGRVSLYSTEPGRRLYESFGFEEGGPFAHMGRALPWVPRD